MEVCPYQSYIPAVAWAVVAEAESETWIELEVQVSSIVLSSYFKVLYPESCMFLKPSSVPSELVSTIGNHTTAEVIQKAAADGLHPPHFW